MKYLSLIASCLLLAACGGTQKSSTVATAASSEQQATPIGPVFSADSAFAFCQQQCDFGPRTMNSEAHEHCGQWIVGQFERFGLHITEQRATLKGFDGTPLLSNNIIASYRPEQADRILICAHWDSRPWADNDPNPDNHRKPVMAANDGASGVAVMLELARLLAENTDYVATEQQAPVYPLEVGIDFVCFDAEDWGDDGHANSWALGAQHWAAHPHKQGYKARYGILLDMVGGQGARFYREAYSAYYAPQVVDRVWKAAAVAGYSSFFTNQDGGAITDDHGPVNEVAKIPCIDIIPYYPDCRESSFGPTWHTVSDDMQHIDRSTLKAVGQTLVQVLWSEEL
ncbi:MAG: M28 family peptidase [Prevotella sp.]|nr:M28 family peptidase [Prevotella sp.]